MFGKSPDFVSKSHLEVPTMSREILQMACGLKREVFQLLSKDKETGFKYLTNYFGFDGLNANKKIHSDFKVDEKFEKLVSTPYSSVADYRTITFLYSPLTIFTNSTMDIDFTGPRAYMKFNNLVKGEYELLVTLKNQLSSKTFVSNLTVIPKRDLEAKPVDIEKVPYALNSSNPVIPLSERVEFTEPVFYASLENKDKDYLKLFELKQRLTEV